MFHKFFSTKSVVATALVGAFAAFSAPAFSQSATASLTVSATVQTACAFGSVTTPETAYNLNFGTFSIGGVDSDAQVDLLIDCASAVPFTLSAAGTANARAMTFGASSLSYALYKTAGRTTLFGNGPTETITGTGVPGLAQPVSIFGRVPQAGNGAAAVGNYTDTVVLTLTF
jgi:spore coat protein U-like protein